MYTIALLWRLTRNKYRQSILYLLERVGIKKSKVVVYKVDLGNIVYPNDKAFPLDVTYKLCTKEDINKLPNRFVKSGFQRDLENGHNMIAAFLNGAIIGYAWFSTQKVYATEIERWVDFDGVYGWRWFVAPNFRKQGLGKKIIENALTMAKALGNKELYTLTETDNLPAQKVLESMGFKKQKIISYVRLFNFKRWMEKQL